VLWAYQSLGSQEGFKPTLIFYRPVHLGWWILNDPAMKKISAFVLVTILVASCATADVHKRHYRSGFYLHRLTETSVKELERVNDQPPVVCQAKPQVSVRSTGDPSAALPVDPKVDSASKKTNIVAASRAPVNVTSVSDSHEENMSVSPVRPKSGSAKVLSITGWVLIGLGALMLLVVSILIGAGLMVLGLVFLLVSWMGGGKVKDISSDGELEDVVYLKNGSVIRGTIIEQVPNVSLKIQTRDGSVFVYKMEEVEKMTKEKPVN
jgi:hypothetical protein